LGELDPADEQFLTYAIIEKKNREIEKWSKMFGGK
jgi:hypothetical protein